MKLTVSTLVAVSLTQPVAAAPYLLHALRERHNSLKPAVATGHINEELARRYEELTSNKNATEKKEDERTGLPIGDFSCGSTYKAHSYDDKWEICPPECPYFAQNRADDEHCTFKCVHADDCSANNPNKPIADDYSRACRAPAVQFCKVYYLDATDRCIECQWGYNLGSDKQCYYWRSVKILLYTLGTVLMVALVIAVTWLTEMVCRPTTNAHELNVALGKRDQCKLEETNIMDDAPSGLDSARSDDSIRQSQSFVSNSDPSVMLGWNSQHKRSTFDSVDDQGHPHYRTQSRIATHPWPISTNLCTTDVGGPGMLLHFNFQVAVMVWALIVAGIYAAFAVLVDSDLWIIGTRNLKGTPRQNCVMVAWGFEAQQRLLWAKIAFLYIAYFSSFILCLLHSLRQLRLYQSLDCDHSTMRDFVAMATGLPAVPGEERVEEDLAKACAEFTGEEVVGISVAWNYKEHENVLMTAVDTERKRWDIFKYLDTPGSSPLGSARCTRTSEEQPSGALGPIRQKMNDVELKYLGPSKEGEVAPETVESILRTITSSHNAFIVFKTELARTRAIEAVNNGDFQYKGEKINFEWPHCEPVTVLWENFGNTTNAEIVRRSILGVGYIALGLFVWVVLFYGPYAWSVFHFNYDNGQEPGFIYGMSFSLVVVAGNAIMYEICNQVSDFMGCRFNDHKQALYMVFYVTACSLNIILDMATTYYLSWETMKNLGFRDYWGTRLSRMDMFPEGFETYAIQRSLAENLKAYAFPSTFLIPFLIEPFPTIILPLWIGKVFVRCHPEIKGADAEAWLKPMPMELGRYADILLNVVLAILIFFFPGGYTTTIFLYLFGSHVWIYVFDHYKVLRVIPSCTFASMDIDWCCHILLAPCCGLILAALVFKSFTYTTNDADLNARHTAFASVAAFFLHCVVHICILIFVIPRFGVQKKDDDDLGSVDWSEVCETAAGSWFTTNPVHCLRSQFIYQHHPPCVHYVPGKEHLLQRNTDIGCYYHVEAPVFIPPDGRIGSLL